MLTRSEDLIIIIIIVAIMVQEELITVVLTHMGVQHMVPTASIIVVVLQDIQSHQVIEGATAAGVELPEAQEAALVTVEVQVIDQEVVDLVNN